jgi:hypothetical protein
MNRSSQPLFGAGLGETEDEALVVLVSPSSDMKNAVFLS